MSTTKYFERVIGYSAPMIPKNEISEAEAGQRRVYYQVRLDEADRVTRIVKMLDGRVEAQFAYAYDALGSLTAAQIIDTEGNSRDIELPRKQTATVTTRT